MPDTASPKTPAQSTVRATQDRPQVRGPQPAAGGFGDFARLQGLAGNRAVAGLFAASPLPAEAEPLEPSLRASMESRFQFDFSGVRIHAG